MESEIERLFDFPVPPTGNVSEALIKMAVGGGADTCHASYRTSAFRCADAIVRAGHIAMIADRFPSHHDAQGRN